MNTPYSNITKVASAAGSIQGITLNLLGGPDSIIEVISPGGLLGDLEKLIKNVCSQDALDKLAEVRAQVLAIQNHVKEIN